MASTYSSFSFICLQSRIRLYTFSLTASFVPLRSTISPLLKGMVRLEYCCWDKTSFLYRSPSSRLIIINRALNPAKASSTQRYSTTSFFCILIVNLLFRSFSFPDFSKTVLRIEPFLLTVNIRKLSHIIAPLIRNSHNLAFIGISHT